MMRVVHCVDWLLPRTETFIQSRLEPRAHEHVALGWRSVDDGLAVPCERHIVQRRAAQVLSDRVEPGVAALLKHVDIVQALTSLRPSLVHAHFGPTGLLFLSGCQALRVPLIVSFYGYDVAQAQEPCFREHYRHLFAAARIVTAEGPELARSLLRCGARPGSIRLLPLSLPAWAEREPSRAEGRPHVLRLLQIARFVEKKGVEDSLRAVALAARAGVPVQFTLIGSGPLEGAIRSAANQLGLDGTVRILPPLAHEDLAAAFARADAFLHPSHVAQNGDTEGGHPTVLLEAMSQHVPVLATRHADIPFAVKHETSGLLVGERDATALAACIASYWRSPELRSRHGEAGRRLVLRRHGREKIAALRDRIYSRAAGSLGDERRARERMVAGAVG